MNDTSRLMQAIYDNLSACYSKMAAEKGKCLKADEVKQRQRLLNWGQDAVIPALLLLLAMGLLGCLVVSMGAGVEKRTWGVLSLNFSVSWVSES